VLESGTPAELMRAGAGAAAVLRFGGPPGIDVAGLGARLGGVVVTEERAGEYVVAAAGTPAVVAALTAWLAEHDLPLADLRAGRQTLEDVFLRLTGSHE
jgi:ABC-2 type transport system ATP-binding protein